MKKILLSVLVLVCFLGLMGCSLKQDEDILHLGLNAEIVKIDPDNQIIYVADSSNEEVFGDMCAIDCKAAVANYEILYVDYDTEELFTIQFSDLNVGDKVIIGAYQSQLNQADGLIEVKQIQLSTQRLGKN